MTNWGGQQREARERTHHAVGGDAAQVDAGHELDLGRLRDTEASCQLVCGQLPQSDISRFKSQLAYDAALLHIWTI